MPDLNKLFDNLHIAQMHLLHRLDDAERVTHQAIARHHATRLHAHAYPQSGSYLPG